MAAIDKAREVAILLQRRRFANRPAVAAKAYQEAIAELTSALGELHHRISEEFKGTLAITFDGDELAVNHPSLQAPVAKALMNWKNPPHLSVQYFSSGDEEASSESLLLVPNPDGNFGWMCRGHIDVGASAAEAADAIVEQTLGYTLARLTVGEGVQIGTE